MTQLVTSDLVAIALERVEGTPFERFVNVFYPAVSGTGYVPLGGVHDGGADGFTDLSLFETASKPGSFLQASIQEDHRAKIRATIKRLREFGRTPKNLTYLTSRVIQHSDVEEENLSEELGVVIRIRDRRYISSHINTSSATTSAFDQFLRPFTDFLNTPGNVPLIKVSDQIKSPAVYVFIRQEVERRAGNSTLLEAVSDGLILWALEGTDPIANIFMSKDQILTKIEEAVPPAKHFIRGTYKKRLEFLSSKNNPTGREVRWYRKEDVYCLPYETRLVVQDENASDEALRLAVVDILANRAIAESGGPETMTQHQAATYAAAALRALQFTFETEGLEFSTFLAGTDSAVGEDYSVADSVDKALEQSGLSGPEQIAAKPVIIRMLRYTIYESSTEERLYLGRMSRTYLLLFSLNAEPRLVEYFQRMASDFYLYIGADILIHALSERYLRPEDQMTTNLLQMLAKAGAHLVLAEPVIDEVYSNLETSDWEYQNHFAAIDAHMTVDLARHASKILIRSYFYARLIPPDPKHRPLNWPNYIEQFCSYANLHKPVGKQELRSYLINKFKMRYEPGSELHKLCDQAELDELTERLSTYKKKKVLAENDALMILGTYGRRDKLNEHSSTTAFGYRTWWLTHEFRVRHHTGDLSRKRGGHYIMRPEFLLNFIALSPSAVEVRRAYENIFPTLLSVKLSGRMKEESFHQLLDQAKQASAMEEPRLRAMMASLSNKLKGDFYKQYENELRNGSDSRQASA